MIRKPAVAGMFYDSDPDRLREQIKWCYEHSLGPGRTPDHIGNKRSIKGFIVPHAGYQYSGPIAAHSYLELANDGFPETFVILSPNHTGMGSGLSTYIKGAWKTPLGEVAIDEEFAENLVSDFSLLDSDSTAHLREHSAEVQLPFLQDILENFQFVPVCMWMQDLETANELGIAIAKTAQKLEKDIVVIASTDFTHYQPQKVAESQDRQVLDAISSLDEKRLIRVVDELNVTMCGYGPVTATMVASKNMGGTEAKILKYATSGDTSGDYSAVVGYGSVIFR